MSVGSHSNDAAAGCWLALLALLQAVPSDADPVPLADVSMQHITAGEALPGTAGGAVIGNAASSQINARSGLFLNHEAQAGSRALNLVNSNDSSLANTFNIWRGQVVTFSPDETTGSMLEVNQLNEVSQQQGQSASLNGYQRSQAEWNEIQRDSAWQSQTLDQVDVHRVSDQIEEVRVTESASQSAVDTELVLELDDRVYIRGHLGQGVAASGTIKADYDGGEADFALSINGGISANAGITINAGILDSSASLSANASAELGMSLLTSIELPAMQIEFSGAGCGVILGSCSASGSTSELLITRSEHNAADIHEFHQQQASGQASESISVHRSPFQLESAEADYIVIDDSSLQLDTELSLVLGDSAQKDVEAMNLVNAIASEVANVTNVSRASRFENLRSRLLLNQVNVVRHGH